jgi:uncharacterized protein (TIGR02145 family)
MKKYPFVFSLLLIVVFAQAQDFKISFAGKGESSSVDTVNVENLTQGTNMALGGSEILHLVGTSTGLNPLPVNADKAFHIYPNPMTEESTIEFVAIESGIAYIEIFDISGRRVGTVQNRLQIAVHSYIVSGLPSGIYTVRINSQAYTYTGKLISNGSPGTGIKISYKGSNAIPVAAQKLKSANSEITMQYTTGDLLKITGRSGNYSTIIMDVPTVSKTITFTFLSCTDADGNNYPIVKIGDQWWMAENLNTTVYNDGTPIPFETDSATWSNLVAHGYCWYNSNVGNKDTYGALYNWFTVNSGKLAPIGWHVPTDEEMTTLTTYLGGDSIAGGKLKETGITHWRTPNAGATNESGFTALPAGHRDVNGSYNVMGDEGYWWSQTEYDTTVWYRNMAYNYGGVIKGNNNRKNGYSVRCLIDASSLPVTQGDEPVTAEEAAFLAAAPDTLIHLEDIILENGDNVRSFLEKYDPEFLTTYPSLKSGSNIALIPYIQKILYIARMLGMGNHLVNDALHTYPSGGANRPAQTGLAYSWGSKDHEKRQTPPTILIPGCNDKLIYGLDCTGMIWQMIQTANLNPPPLPSYNFFVEYITDAPKWTAAFKASADYKDLEMKDLGKIPQFQMKNGDMILWRRHVGIYLFGNFYQSNGDPNAPACTNNLAQDKGPRCISLSYILSWKKLGDYHVFRPVCDEKYTLTLKEDFPWPTLSTTPYCVLGNYVDSTVTHITVTKEGEVILDHIDNSMPAITFTSAYCNCLNMHFANGSAQDYTNFVGTLHGNGEGLLCKWTYTTCFPTDLVECTPGSPETIKGLLFTGQNSWINIELPEDSLVYPWPLSAGSTLTIKHVKR